MNQSDATNLAFVNGAGQAIVKVDNTSFVPYNQKRNSVRIPLSTPTRLVFPAQNSRSSHCLTTYRSVLDPKTTMPWAQSGCSTSLTCLTAARYVCLHSHRSVGYSLFGDGQVWPGVWTSAFKWPDQGEIDIVEGINKMTSNQMALHTVAGCNAATGTNAINQPAITNCNDTQGSGCTVVSESYMEKVSLVLIKLVCRPRSSRTAMASLSPLTAEVYGRRSSTSPVSSASLHRLSHCRFTHRSHTIQHLVLERKSYPYLTVTVVLVLTLRP